jgi:hypothetical protein
MRNRTRRQGVRAEDGTGGPCLCGERSCDGGGAARAGGLRAHAAQIFLE